MGGGSVSKYAPRYFKIDFSKADDMWEQILSVYDADIAIKDSEIPFNIGALYKSKENNTVIISAYPFINARHSREYSFVYMPLWLPNDMLEPLGITNNLLTFEDILNNIGKLLALFGKADSPRVLSTDGLTEITEEEFYKID